MSGEKHQHVHARHLPADRVTARAEPCVRRFDQLGTMADVAVPFRRAPVATPSLTHSVPLARKHCEQADDRPNESAGPRLPRRAPGYRPVAATGLRMRSGCATGHRLAQAHGLLTPSACSWLIIALVVICPATTFASGEQEARVAPGPLDRARVRSIAIARNRERTRTRAPCRNSKPDDSAGQSRTNVGAYQ